MGAAGTDNRHPCFEVASFAAQVPIDAIPTPESLYSTLERLQLQGSKQKAETEGVAIN